MRTNFQEEDGEKTFQEKMVKPVVVAIQEGEQVTSTVELHGEIQMRRVLKTQIYNSIRWIFKSLTWKA